MAISAQSLRNQLINETTYRPQEIVPERYWKEPQHREKDTPIIHALVESQYRFLRTFSTLGIENGLDIIDRVERMTSDSGIIDEDDKMWINFLGANIWHREIYREIPLSKQAEMATDLFIGVALRNVLESKRTFQDESDLVVQLGAEVNRHLSIMHFEKIKDSRNISKLIYDYFQETPQKFALLTKVMKERLIALGINPLIADIRMYYDKEKNNLSWWFFDSGVSGSYSTRYNPNGDHSVCAVCGIDGSGKTTLLNKLNRVVLPIAHPDDQRMIDFFNAFGDNGINYQRELELFKSMRSGALKNDLTLTAFRFVRNLLSHLDSLYYPLTVFQNIVLDRSSLTNIAYVRFPRKFGEAVAELVMDNFLNPRKIVVIDTPVSIAHYRATNAREKADEFDAAEFYTYQTRATMYRILSNVLPNVVALNTYDGEREEIRNPDVLAKELKRLLYDDQYKYS